MKIVICDDEKSTCAELEDILKDYAVERGRKIHTEVFLRGDTLKEYLARGEEPDVLFLDIRIPAIDGVEVGVYIREVLENEKICIVYISSKEQYALQLFQNRPFDFLVKPLERQKIFQVLDRIFRVTGKGVRDFEYQNHGSLVRVSWQEILYFQSNGRKISIITKGKNHSFYGKLTDLEIKVPKEMFLKIHKSYLINFNYVSEYNYEWVRMVNGDILNISKRNRAEIRKTIMEREMDEFGNCEFDS